MKISFLICGISGRPWEKLKDKIQRQIDTQEHECEVLTSVDSGQKSSGSKRNSLVRQSHGEYIAFIDDDDEISDDYVSVLAQAAVHHKPDIVSFTMEVSLRGVRRHRRKAHENWELGLWNDDRGNGLMTANHLCCWRREIATKVAWCDRLGYGDDQLWYKPLIAANIAKSCWFTGKVLYKYLLNMATTQNQTPRRVFESRRYFGAGLRCFMISGEILIEDGHQSSFQIKCRNAANEIVEIDTRQENPFHVVKLA